MNKIKKYFIITIFICIILNLTACSERIICECPEGYTRCHIPLNFWKCINGYVSNDDINNSEQLNGNIKIYHDSNLKAYTIINLESIEGITIGKHNHCDGCKY